MFLAGIRHCVRWGCVIAFTLSSHAWAQESAAWTEDAVLRDGRNLTVRIEGNNITQPFYLGYQKSKFNQFKLTFQHPDTRDTITWQGARYFTPVLLDFVDGTPYLVVYGRPTHATSGAYGCPELPYIYLRYGPTDWEPVALEKAPAELAQANLSVHGMDVDTAGQHLSGKAVAQKIQLDAQQSAGQMQPKIPRSVGEWHTDKKGSALNDRLVGDCRPPPHAALPALALPPPTEGNISLMESSDYVPEKEYSPNDWNQLVTDPRRTAACKNLFQRVDAENYQQDLRFSQDSTASKRVPYSRAGVFEAGVQLLCDDHVWFIQSLGTPHKITVTQFTRTGDWVFSTTFFRPHDEGEWVGTMRLPSLRSEGDYLYFDWLLSRNTGAQTLLKRSLSLRVPTSPLAQ